MAEPAPPSAATAEPKPEPVDNPEPTTAAAVEGGEIAESTQRWRKVQTKVLSDVKIEKNIVVGVRLRPLTPEEIKTDDSIAWKVDTDEGKKAVVRCTFCLVVIFVVIVI